MPSTDGPRRPCRWSYLGNQAYDRIDRLQQHLRQEVRERHPAGFLLLLEHPHVITLGRNAGRVDVLADSDWLAHHRVPVVETDRGGKVTYHGPGQLIGYPIVDLSPDRRDLRRYVRDLQRVLVAVLQDFGVFGEARSASHEIGVWVDGRKIASLGVHVSRWITTHGFALNVSTDLSYFAAIVPCGLAGVQMTSIESCTGRAPTLARVASRCAVHFGEVFDRRMTHLAAARILERWPIAS